MVSVHWPASPFYIFQREACRSAGGLAAGLLATMFRRGSASTLGSRALAGTLSHPAPELRTGDPDPGRTFLLPDRQLDLRGSVELTRYRAATVREQTMRWLKTTTDVRANRRLDKTGGWTRPEANPVMAGLVVSQGEWR